MRVSRISALLITAMMIPAISGCTTQGTPAPDAEDGLDGGLDESNVQEEIISAEPHKGSAE